MTGSVPSPRCELDLVELQGEVYMYGGRMGTATLADFYILDMTLLAWTRLDAAEDPGGELSIHSVHYLHVNWSYTAAFM